MIKVKALEFGDEFFVDSCGYRYFVLRRKSKYKAFVSRYLGNYPDVALSPLTSQVKARLATQAHHTQHVLSMIEIDTPTNQGKQP